MPVNDPEMAHHGRSIPGKGPRQGWAYLWVPAQGFQALEDLGVERIFDRVQVGFGLG